MKRTILILLIAILSFTGFLHVFPNSVSAQYGVNWNSTFPVEIFSGNNISPSALQANNGSIWLTWASDQNGPSMVNIYYKTMSLVNGVWINHTRTALTTTGRESSPTIAQLNNNTIFIIWSSNRTSYYNLSYKRFNIDLRGNPIWSGTTILTSVNAEDGQPSASVGRDGTLWVVWNRQNMTDNQVYYKTLKNSVWSKETRLTSGTNWSWQASVSAGKDGKVRVAYASGPQGGAYQIFYQTFNGTGWEPSRQIVTLPSGAQGDTHPSLVQDRNGTIWLFWERTVLVGIFIDSHVYGKSSTDNGATWPVASEAQLTFDHGGFIYVDQQPLAIQSARDKSIYVYYSTNTASIGEFDLYAVKSSPIAPVHDVGLSYLTPPFANASLLYAGGFNNPYAGIYQSPVVTVTVTVQNSGDYNETVTVSLTMTNTTSYVLTPQHVIVHPGRSNSTIFNWDTTGVRPARYGFSASVAIPVEPLGNLGDDSLVLSNQVHLLPLGDIDQDGSVTLTDVSVVFYNYGFSCYTPATCSPRYNPFADANGNGIIDIVDIGVVSRNFDIFT